MAENLPQQLRELGSKLASLPSDKDQLLKLLEQAATCLSELDQSPSAAVLEAIQPFLDVIVKAELLTHQDRDVKLLVTTCICEITRITAPEAPYSDDVLKDIFHLIVETFGGLKDTSGPSFGRTIIILETVAKYRSCVVMLDLECDDLVKEMFSTLFAVASEDHAENVFSSMQSIMVALLEESEDIGDDLLFVMLSVLGRNRSGVTSTARRLAMNVIQQCEGRLEPAIKQFLISSISGDNRSLNSGIDYHEVIYDIYHSAPHILSGVVPHLTGELLIDQLETRLKAVKLVGDLFALPNSVISDDFQPIFSEFLKRLADRVVEVRMSVLERLKSCLLSNPLRAEAPQIIDALCDRLLDYDESIRKQVVAVVCDVACSALSSISVDTVKLVAERLRDKSLLVKTYTMERLAEIHKLYCLKCCDGSTKPGEFDWIPGKILRCFYDKDFRSDIIESVLCESLFPTELPIKDRVMHWVRVFSGLDIVEVKALEKILEQKQRLQQEMQRYLSLRNMCQDDDAPEIPKKISFCFRVMSRTFSDPAKAEENFQILDQLKDANIWKILTCLLDPDTSLLQSHNYREDLLKILGDEHHLYDFLSTLSVKCSYMLFNKEHVKAILLEVDANKSAGNAEHNLSCMNILVNLANFSPSLLSGVEEELVKFLKDDDEMIKEGVLQVLAKAGGTIREQLALSSSSIDLILERLCLEGSRKQAKYAVHALAAITKDDGLKSLSVLYKRLVDILEEKTRLPAVLQSLGCIAQTAMPVFETRENEIEDFIKSKILNCNTKPEERKKASWDDISETCMLKIFGIKTLVKSYLPIKDAHLRPGIDDLLKILKNILSLGEISEVVESSPVDKAHLRLASAKALLRLARQWDHKIPIDVFFLTLRTSEISFPQVRKIFLSKVHQYIKDRLLDAKYTAAFVLNLMGSSPTEFEEERQNLADVVRFCHQSRARQFSMQTDMNTPMTYPEYILPYLIHALAHNSCPNVDECKDVKQFEVIYRQLYLFICMLLNGGEDGQSEVGTKDRESICAIVTVFKSIKHSEDVVDAEKSKNSYAVCDLGLSIIKRLTQKDNNLQDVTKLISLPSVLYKSCEKKEGSNSKACEGETGSEGQIAGEEKMTSEGKIASEEKMTSEGQIAGEEKMSSEEQITGQEKAVSEGQIMGEEKMANEGKTTGQEEMVSEGKTTGQEEMASKGQTANEGLTAGEKQTANVGLGITQEKTASEGQTPNEVQMIDAGQTTGQRQTVNEGLGTTQEKAASEVQTPNEVQMIDAGQTAGQGKIASEGQTWLSDESVLAHFESLKFDVNGIVQTEIVKDDIPKDNDKDGNEVPLGKIIKHLKSQGSKARKGAKSKSSPNKSKNAENDIDILRMVREINFDDREKSNKFEASNGHGHSPKTKSKTNSQNKKRKGSYGVHAPVPKRPRSLSAHNAFKSPVNTSKSPATASKGVSLQTGRSFQSPKQDVDSEEKILESRESDYLVSSVPKTALSKCKGKRSDKRRSAKSPKVEDSDDDDDSNKPNMLMETDEINTVSNSKSSVGSSKKRKRRSIAGLAKCSFKDDETDLSDLISCRIKVWWPMDKEFYEGIVKSYDPIKGKHVVLYDDGDIEVLSLEKERWELVNNDHKSSKKSKSSKGSPISEMSPGKKNKSSNGSQTKKKSSKTVKGKRTPKKNSKRRQKKVSESKESSDVSDPEPTSISKIDSINSSDSEGDHDEIMDENATVGEESDKEAKSVSKGKMSKGSEANNHTEESDEEKLNSELLDTTKGEEGKALKADELSDKDDKKEEKTGSEGNQEAQEEDKAESEENQEAQEESKSDSKGGQETKSPGENATPQKESNDGSSNPSDAQDAEISDDEPLSIWKNRVGKPSSKH